jgi:hypothetical protein
MLETCRAGTTVQQDDVTRRRVDRQYVQLVSSNVLPDQVISHTHIKMHTYGKCTVNLFPMALFN